MDTAFSNIKQGLQEAIAHAIAHAQGDARGVRVYRPREIDVKAVRAKLGMTQEQFAAQFGFSPATLRHWERGDRSPRGPALVLLNVIERNPEAVIDALAETHLAVCAARGADREAHGLALLKKAV
jgi:putative transcriptional regulator